MTEKSLSETTPGHVVSDSVCSTLPPEEEALAERLPDPTPPSGDPPSDERSHFLAPTFLTDEGSDTEEVLVTRAAAPPVSESAALAPSFVPSTSLDGNREECADSTSERSRPGADVPCVPGYEILAELGEGGMGIVYKARQVRLKRLVALKMLRAIHASRKARERFRLEAESVARLQHPNIVQIHEVGEYQGCPFFSLEYMEGGSLDEWLEGRPLDAGQATRLILTLARAVQFAHDHGIVHRDLKPGNILLGHRPSAIGDRPEKIDDLGSVWPMAVKIADFGLAKQLDEEVRLSKDGEILGTPSYMASEQAAGRTRDIGPCTDVYALGAILYELLTGRAPFLAKSVEETVKQVCEQDPVPPRQLLGRLPRDLNTICLKCLQKEPKKRYASAADLAYDLDRFLAGEAIAARPIGRVERAIKWCRRHPARAMLIGCLLAALSAPAVFIPFHIRLLETEVREGKEEIRRLNRENLRYRVRALLEQGRQARDRRDWQDARMRFTEILDSLDAHGDLMDDDLWERQHDAREELAAVDRQLDDQKADAERRWNYRGLFKWRDEAFFLLNRDLFTPVGASPSESIEAANRGLVLFGLAGDTAGDPILDGYNPKEKEELRAGLYEVLLIRAEATARPRPGQTNVQRAEQAGQALAILDRAARLSPDSAIVHQRRARYLRQQGLAEAAAREQQQADALAPQTALGWFLHGCDLGLDSAHRAEAIHAFDETIRHQHNLFWAHFFRALAYQKQGNPAEARASLTVCIDRRDQFVWNYLLRGLLLIELGELRAAKADLDRAESLPLDAASRYVLHLNRGTLAMKEQNRTEAVRQFEKAVHEKPDAYQAYVNLAEACGQQNQLRESIRWLDRAIDLQPANHALYRSRALIEQRDNKPQAALDDFDKAIRLVSAAGSSLDLARYHFERGAILFLIHRHREAVAAFNDSLAVDLEPLDNTRQAGDADRLRGNTQLLRAQSLLQLKDYKAARAAFDRYLEKGTPTVDIWRQHALTNMKLNDNKGVLEDYTKALALKKDAEGLTLRGWAYLFFDLPNLARIDFDEAIQLDRKHAEAFAGRGFARVKLDQVERGIDDARQAVKLKPKSPEVRYQSARVLAQAVDAVVRTGSLANGDLRQDYETEALTLLRQAAELLADRAQRSAFWSDSIRRDKALLPIMRAPGFRDLDTRFAGPPK